MTWSEKLWAEQDKHLRNLVSARAVSLYLTLGGIGLQASDSQYRHYGPILATLGACMNNYWPRDEREANDLPLFSTVSHLFGQYESSRQWKTSYNFNVQCNDDAKDARIEDKKRFEDQEKKSDKRYEEQEKKTDERIKNDTIRQLKEAIKQTYIDEYRDGLKPLSKLEDHRKFLQEELYKLQPEQRELDKKDAESGLMNQAREFLFGKSAEA